VDDGIATGATVQAAARVLRRQGARWIVLAVPVIASATLPILSAEVNEIVALEKPKGFRSVGNYYRNFGPTSAKEVKEILNSFDTPRA
jgi:predicted phosphoribosyltransferase